MKNWRKLIAISCFAMAAANPYLTIKLLDYFYVSAAVAPDVIKWLAMIYISVPAVLSSSLVAQAFKKSKKRMEKKSKKNARSKNPGHFC